MYDAQSFPMLCTVLLIFLRFCYILRFCFCLLLEIINTFNYTNIFYEPF